MEKAQNENRIVWVDIAKGYGIILVILGHIGFGRFGDWIYSFHLPLFVFLSGYVFKTDYEWKPFIIRISKSLLFPYFCFAIIVFICENYSFSGLSFQKTMEFFTNVLLQRRFKYIWFLQYLFIIELFFYFIIKITRNIKVLLIICAVLSIIGHLYNIMTGVPVIWNLDAVMFSMLFFCLGYCYRTCWEKQLIKFEDGRKKIGIATASLIISINTVFVAGNKLELFGAEFGKPGLSYISAVFGIIFIIAVSKSYNVSAIAYFGRNSLSYYLTHLYISFPIAVNILRTFGIVYENYMSGITAIIVKLFILVLTIMACTVLDYSYKIIKRKLSLQNA